MHAVLAYASIGVASIRASHTTNERDKIIARFNTKDSDINVLVINQSLTMAGLNLHHFCHIGINIQYGWNYWTLIQITGRISRMGQSHNVTWYILVTEGTYGMVTEDKMCRKLVPEILFTGRIPAWITGSRLQRLIAFEILRFKVGHPFNRFVWTVNPPTTADDYTSPKMTRMGKLASSIVAAVLKTSDNEKDQFYLKVLEAFLVSLLHQYGDGVEPSRTNSSLPTFNNTLRGSVATRWTAPLVHFGRRS